MRIGNVHYVDGTIKYSRYKLFLQIEINIMGKPVTVTVITAH